MRQDIEQDFFGAEDREDRARLFEELDAQSRKGAFERVLWSGIAIGATIAVVVAAALMGESDENSGGAPPDLPVAEIDSVRPSTPVKPAVAAARAPTPPPTGSALEQEPLALVEPAKAPVVDAPKVAPEPIEAPPVAAPPVAAPPPVAAAVSDPMQPAPVADPAEVDSPWLRRRLAKRTVTPPGSLADAESALAQGEYQKTIDLLRDAEDDFSVASLRGRALLEMGKDEAALDALKVALQAKPEDGDTLVMLGSLLQEDDPKQARRHFEAYLRRYPNGAHARELKGVVVRL